MAVNKERFYELLDRLSDKDLELVSELMERLANIPVNREIPLDDEPTTQDELDAIKDAHEAYLRGELISLKDVEHELRN
ncbi:MULTISPECIES: hypothetical protein [Paenibacillus]|jgi:hypothetical protein|uniref:Uncharacterized protein n=4 Tax=Paenibacillus TaxID=44249 RepID=A0A919XUY2_9BACL|nr:MULTISPECIES: hypothetical protein [Paenibacillus]KHF32264.1 hypothetical protein CM49_05538 [Paenibacillus sp. P1XP2]EOS58459.1 hypothetical protein C812_00378 [Paenibacillus barengoltzii G22]MDU0331437.1 hypothetical protein [Paenibacillus sp. 3LSP]MEC2344005.1 hypothetical protein [Paenibacillus barengoltzii]SMF69347.1 hypothetical protein SAMN02744124_04393 [Paenibacillus barengoltzii J12]